MLHVCGHTKHVVVLVALHSCQHFTCCQLLPHIHFSPVCEFLTDFVDSHTAKTGLLRCCLYTPPSVTVDCRQLLPNFELYCGKLILRSIPRISGPHFSSVVLWTNQCWVRLRGDAHKTRNSFASIFADELHPLGL